MQSITFFQYLKHFQTSTDNGRSYRIRAVSYTHLDVYKRQSHPCSSSPINLRFGSVDKVVLPVPDKPQKIAELVPSIFVLAAVSYTHLEEGVRIARKEIQDLVITDVMMPIMNGFECCRILKEDLKTCHSPCLLYTSSQISTAFFSTILHSLDSRRNKCHSRFHHITCLLYTSRCV